MVDNGWPEYAKLVLTKLDDLAAESRMLRQKFEELSIVAAKCEACKVAEDIVDLKVEMRETKVRSGVIGVVSGAGSAWAQWFLK